MSKKVLLIGLGGFGKNHLKAWHEMGFGENLYIAELNEKLHEQTKMFNVPKERITTDYTKFLDKVDIVDIVTPSTSHFPLCKAAFEAGKDVFVEKPMTMDSKEANALADLVKKSGKILQVGFYYRFHPASAYLKNQIEQKNLGQLRYVSGNFMGFKRARTDVGVTHTDGIHFVDLFNWLVGEAPISVYAIIRDHFKRGMEDASVVILNYPNGTFAKVESGYIQPGRWHDKVVPNAFTSKEIFACGGKSTVEIDYETENLVQHEVHHEFKNGTWHPIGAGSHVPGTATANPIQMIASELRDFLICVETRKKPSADVLNAGVILAKVMEAIYDSAKTNTTVQLNWTEEEKNSFKSVPELAGASIN